MEPVIRSIVYATPRIECPELGRVKEQLVARYGKQVEQVEGVDPRLTVKLGVRNPDPHLINRYLDMIATSYEVNWRPPPEAGNLLQQQQHPSEPPMLPAPLEPLPPPPYTGTSSPAPPSTTSSVPDFEELTKRFEQLKQQKK